MIRIQNFVVEYLCDCCVQVYTKSYSDDVGSGYGIPSKLQQHFQPHQMVYEKQQYIEPGPVKSSKYPELFSNPLGSSPFAFGGGVDVFPVDVENAIPTTSAAQKLDTSVDQQNGFAANNIDIESMIMGKSEVDLSSLLTMLTPDNKMSDSPVDANSGYLIPTLDFLSESSPHQAKGDGVYDSTVTAMQPFGSYDIPVLDNSNVVPNSPEEQTFWDGVEEKSTPGLSTNPMMAPDTNLPLSFNMASPIDDPFMSELLKDEPILAFPPDESRYNQAPTPTSDIYHVGLHGDHSPLPASGHSSPVTPGSSSGSTAPPSWDSNLQDLFEKTVDLTDMMDFMLPPPPKRHADQNLTPSQWQNDEQKEAELPPREIKVEPASPATSQVKSPSIASPIEVDATSEKGGGAGKGKSTILFGKHEDEIIHKLLSPRPGSHKRPVSRDKLVSMPVEEFNHLLEQASLSEIEVAFMKEWRRRGKNKAAAQIARKRKREEVSDLELEVKALRKQKAELNKKYDRLRSQIATLKKRSMSAEDRVYRQQTKLTGKAVSRDTHLIHLTDDDKLLLVPRISSQVLTISK